MCRLNFVPIRSDPRIIVLSGNRPIQASVDNVFLLNVLDIVKRKTNECGENGACNACYVSGMSNLHCEDCDKLLCTQYLRGHRDHA